MSIDNKLLIWNVARGVLKLYILWLLDQRPMHGYEITKRVERLIDVRLSPSIVYSFLYKLEKLGLIRGRRKRGQNVKMYTITCKGCKVLRDLSNRLSSFLKELSEEEDTSKSKD